MAVRPVIRETAFTRVTAIVVNKIGRHDSPTHSASPFNFIPFSPSVLLFMIVVIPNADAIHPVVTRT